MVDQFVGGFTCSAITAAITCPLAVASTRILLDAGGGATNTEKVEVPQVVKELESKVEEIETQIAQRVESEIGKTQQAVQAIQKEVGTAIFAATNTPRTSTTTLNKESLVPLPPTPPPPPPLSPPRAPGTENKKSVTKESLNKESAMPIEEEDLELVARGGRLGSAVAGVSGEEEDSSSSINGRLGTAILRPEARPFLKTEALTPGGAVGADVDVDAGSLGGGDEDSEPLLPTLRGALKGWAQYTELAGRGRGAGVSGEEEDSSSSINSRAQYTEQADRDGVYQKTMLSIRSDAGDDSVPAERARPRVGAGIYIYIFSKVLYMLL